MADKREPAFTLSTAVQRQKDLLPKGAREWAEFLAACALVSLVGLCPIFLLRPYLPDWALAVWLVLVALAASKLGFALKRRSEMRRAGVKRPLPD